LFSSIANYHRSGQHPRADVLVETAALANAARRALALSSFVRLSLVWKRGSSKKACSGRLRRGYTIREVNGGSCIPELLTIMVELHNISQHLLTYYVFVVVGE
jgi:hypothetical protein